MIFFLKCFICINAFSLTGAVSYGTPQTDDSTTKYTLFAIAGAFLLPILLGFVYSKISMWRFRRSAGYNDVKASGNIGENSAGAAAKKTSLAAHLLRLTEMRSNPVLRLWWKRQEKLYSALDNDLEAQKADDEDDSKFPKINRSAENTRPHKEKVKHKVEDPGSQSPDKKAKKEKKEKKEKAAKASDVEQEVNQATTSGISVDLVGTLDDLTAMKGEDSVPKRPHKEKKSKNEKLRDSTESRESIDKSSGEARPKKEKKDKKASDDRDAGAGDIRAEKKEKKQKRKNPD